MTQRNFWKYLTRVHRYAGLILGVQILIWFASGFFMSFFDIDQVRGQHVAEKAAFSLDTQDVISIAEIEITDMKSVTLISAAGSPVYKVASDEVSYIDARSGADWAGIDEAAARRAVKRYYKGEPLPETIVKLDQAPIEYRGALPVWQVTYDDGPKTRLYLDANTGELKAVCTRLWRVFDFMWMLHIMDYDGRDNINNWWLWLYSGFASLFAFSGIMLVLHRIVLRPRRRAKIPR